jgi:ArsR family transcriptional regulator, arsenate/arsenite/antimonite-responsive transcriptional repressor
MEMINTDNFKFIAKAAKALGDRTRLLIFREIVDRGRLNMSEVQQLTNLAQPSVSFHVKQLVNAGLVDTERKGREVYIFINPSKLEEFNATLDNIKALYSSQPLSSPK